MDLNALDRWITGNYGEGSVLDADDDHPDFFDLDEYGDEDE